MTVNYRESYNLFATNGITEKKSILFASKDPSYCTSYFAGNKSLAAPRASWSKRILESRRDWGYAPEYVEAIWRMLQQDEAEDFVVGSGEAHSVQEFVQEAFTYVDLDWREYVRTDSKYLRPREVDFLVADPAKARRILSWEPKIALGLQPIGAGM